MVAPLCLLAVVGGVGGRSTLVWNRKSCVGDYNEVGSSEAMLGCRGAEVEKIETKGFKIKL